MTNDMRVYYNDGEIETFKRISFDAHDVEQLIVPELAALIIDDYEGKQVTIFLDQVKKLEFNINEE